MSAKNPICSTCGEPTPVSGFLTDGKQFWCHGHQPHALSQHGEPVAVRPLDWPKECPRGKRINSIGGLLKYCITHYGADPDTGVVFRWALEGCAWSEAFFAYEHAIAAVQADYEARIRSALVSPPSPAPFDMEPLADTETAKARAAAVICEVGALCGWPAPDCKSREAAEALYNAGLLHAVAPSPEPKEK